MVTSQSIMLTTESRRPRAPLYAAVFVAIEAVVLLLIVTQQLPRLMPERLATQIGHNSESFILAILLTSYLGWRRLHATSAGRGGRRRVGLGPVATVLMMSTVFVLGLVLLGLDNPRLKTLNEPVFAVAVLIGYCALTPRRPALALGSGVALAFTAAFFGTDLVRLQAECLVALILAPIGFDLMSRWILSPGLVQSLLPGVLWGGFLLLAPFGLMVLKPLDLGWFVDDAVLYAARGNEAFWGLFLVQLLALLAWRPAAKGVMQG